MALENKNDQLKGEGYLTNEYTKAKDALKTIIPKHESSFDTPNYMLGGVTPVSYVLNGGDPQTVRMVFEPLRGC